jgi:hypothetical protein
VESAELRRLWKERPFHPLTLKLKDGRRLRVAKPEFMLVPPKAVVAVVSGARGGFSILDVAETEAATRSQPPSKLRRRTPGTRKEA